LQHYSFITPERSDHLFYKKPISFSADSDKQLLATALGGTLYIPCTKPNLADSVRKMAAKGAASVVLCLEDSIPDAKLPEAEQNLVRALKELVDSDDKDTLPLMFVRVRTPEHFVRVIDQNKTNISVLTGFVFPKFENTTGLADLYVDVLKSANAYLKAEVGMTRPLYFMPVIESPNVAFRETRKGVLAGIKSVLDQNQDLLLAVRIGATDISSVYGLRRPRDFTVYDVHVVASTLADIINMFGRASDNYIVTGPVWEHFIAGERLFKPQLRDGLFASENKELRRKLLTEGYDSFIREIGLDRANGFTGKTIIHPSHINLVHSLSVVTHEEYNDALTITSDEHASGGATSSIYKNKMNEIKPHFSWALKTLTRANAFGVANEGIDFVDFLELDLV